MATNKKTMVEQFMAARRASCPLVAIATHDQQATQAALAQASAKQPVVRWDAVTGLAPVNEHGEKALTEAGIKADDTIGFTEAMLAARMLKRGTLVIAHNAHRQLESQEPSATAAAVQALANQRDDFKTSLRMTVLLGPSSRLPLELQADAVTLAHELPEKAELATLVDQMVNSAQRANPKFETSSAAAKGKAVEALTGLTLFTGEQALAQTMIANGDALDVGELWASKRAIINATRGLSVWDGPERFGDIVGLDALKQHLRNRMRSRTPVGVAVFVDEIDKVFANVESDTSGVRMDQVRTFLTEMENNEWRGLIAVGVPGAGKSMIAKAFGNEAGVPTVALDLGGMESKYVGESEAALRQAIEIIKAVGNGHAYFIATSNNATVMRPELQRRFTDGMWFFDLPGEEERRAAWLRYIAKYELTKTQAKALPADDGWTPAEIRNCCRYAWDAGCTLADAARFVLPMAQSRGDMVEELRRYAHNRFLDAAKPGAYQHTTMKTQVLRRALEMAPTRGEAN